MQRFAAWCTALFIICASHGSFARTADEAVKELYQLNAAAEEGHADPLAADQRPRYFSQRLLRLWDADEAYSAAHDEPGNLNGDALYNAQEWEIANLFISPATPTPQGAEVTVSFLNFGMKNVLVFSLIMEKGDWKVDDIRYASTQDIWTLSELLSQPHQ